ncbi:MAG: 50S ribosomal protein L25 [bacterium]|nr:50S ribosomal protein L25 [bacterium]
MQSLILESQTRNIFGKKLKTLRKEGMVPAVLYGPGVKSSSLQVNLRDLEKIYKEAGENTIVKLKIKDDKIPERNVLIYDIARDPVRRNIIHIDFLQVKMDQAIKAAIPLEFTGESSAVKNEGGIMVKNIHEVEVEALPADLPHKIVVDISSLNTFEDAILVKDLPVSSKVKILAESELMVAQVQPPRTEAELEALKEEVVEKVEEVKVETEEKKAEKEQEGE